MHNRMKPAWTRVTNATRCLACNSATVFDNIKPNYISQMERINAEYEEALANEEYERYYKLNLTFHDIFLDLSDNEIIKKILTPIKRRLYDFPRRDYIKNGN